MKTRHPPRSRIVASLALALGSVAASAADSPRPAIVELYTSEGCSSCPPAEKLIESLAGRSDVLPLAFHVDYWNGLGWQDRFSMKEATQRQKNHAETLNLSTVGTPQLIVDGRTAVWGASSAELQRALQPPRIDIALSVERQARSFIVRAPESKQPYDVYVVGYLPKAVTAIKRGENAGRTITEVNVVRYIRRIGGSVDTAHSWHVALDALPKDAERLVVLLQNPASGAIVGARAIDPQDLG